MIIYSQFAKKLLDAGDDICDYSNGMVFVQGWSNLLDEAIKEGNNTPIFHSLMQAANSSDIEKSLATLQAAIRKCPKELPVSHLDWDSWGNYHEVTYTWEVTPAQLTIAYQRILESLTFEQLNSVRLNDTDKKIVKENLLKPLFASIGSAENLSALSTLYSGSCNSGLLNFRLNPVFDFFRANYTKSKISLIETMRNKACDLLATMSETDLRTTITMNQVQMLSQDLFLSAHHAKGVSAAGANRWFGQLVEKGLLIVATIDASNATAEGVPIGYPSKRAA